MKFPEETNAGQGKTIAGAMLKKNQDG